MRVLFLGLLLALPLPAAAESARTPNPSYAAKKAGLKVLDTVVADWDGDGKDELVSACQGKRGVVLCVFSHEQAPELLFEAQEPVGRRFKEIEVKHLVPPEPAREVLIEAYDQNPDEKIKRVRVYTGYREPREIFSSVIFRSKDKSKRPVHERLPGVVEYGDARAGWYFLDLEEDGSLEAIVRDKPKVLEVKRKGGNAYLLVGVREKIFEFTGRADKGEYRERERGRFTDFLPAYPVESVRASSVWLPKAEREQLEADAMAAAVYAAAEGENPEELPEAPEVDYRPYYARAADGDLKTAWIEDARGPGNGEWVELDLGQKREIHMVRIVSGCVSSRRAYRSHNVPTNIEVKLGPGESAYVDRYEPESPLRPAIGILEVPTPGNKFAKQTLVFFRGEEMTDKVRVTLRKSARQGRGNRSCLSEVSVH